MNEYIDKAGLKHEHIYLLTEDYGEFLKGWYFGDEAELLNGPFDTLEEVEDIFKSYCKEYLGDEK